MFCSNCGKELPDTTKFCIHCGTPTSQFNSFHTAESSVSTQLQKVYSENETISETETGNKSFVVAMVLSMLPAPWGRIILMLVRNLQVSTQLQKVYSENETISETETGNKSFVVAMVLSMLPAPWGLHRIYTGKIVSGLIQFGTAGLYFIWSSIDVLLIVTNRFKDAQGKKLRGYNKGIAFVGFIVWLFAISGFIYAIAVTSGQPSNNHESRPQETVIPAETCSPEKKAETKNSSTPDVELNHSTPEIPNNADNKTKKSESAIKPLPTVLPKKTIEEHRAIIADGAIYKYPETAQELKKEGYPKMLKKYGVNGIKKINSLLPKVAEKASKNPTMDKIVNVDISNNRSTKNNLIFYVDAENSNRLYISENDLASDTPILSNQEKLKQLLPEHEKLCEELIKQQLTHPSTYDKSYFDSISQTQEYTNVIRIAFSAKNSFNLKINYIAIFRINADSEIVYQDIQEKKQ